jgi:hypothetical protein
MIYIYNKWRRFKFIKACFSWSWGCCWSFHRSFTLPTLQRHLGWQWKANSRRRCPIVAARFLHFRSYWMTSSAVKGTCNSSLMPVFVCHAWSNFRVVWVTSSELLLISLYLLFKNLTSEHYRLISAFSRASHSELSRYFRASQVKYSR